MGMSYKGSWWLSSCRGHHPTIQPERSAEVYEEDFCIEKNFFVAQHGFVSRLTIALLPKLYPTKILS